MRKLTTVMFLYSVAGSVLAHTPDNDAPLLIQLTHPVVSPHHLPFALLLMAVAVTGIIIAGRLVRRRR